MKYNKDMIQWKKDKKENAEDPNAVLQRRKKQYSQSLNMLTNRLKKLKFIERFITTLRHTKTTFSCYKV